MFVSDVDEEFFANTILTYLKEGGGRGGLVQGEKDFVVTLNVYLILSYIPLAVSEKHDFHLRERT